MDGLKKKDNFFQMQSQLRVSALLKIKYDVSLEEPVVNENGDEITAIDILVAIGNSQIIIEVTSLDMFRDLKYLGSVMDIKNRAKEKITQKVEKQISKIASVYPVPILLLIDKSRAPEIDLEDIYDALGGTSTVNLVRDKETPEIRQFYMSRVNDGIGLTIKGGDRLSAIILCNSDISRQDLALRLTGDIILNPYTSVKVDENIVKELKATLFDVSI